MKVLVFGGSGFLGSSLTVVLEQESFDCFTVSRSDVKSSYNFDISNYEEFSILPNNYFDAVVNCATVLPGGNYLDSNYLDKIYKTNILGSQNICKWLESQTSIKKIINCSTLVVVAKPWPKLLSEGEATYPTGNHVLYSSSKLVQELIFHTFAQNNQRNLIQIRFSALYGESMNWSGLICSLIDQARLNDKIILKNATKVSADFLNVKDAARIITAALNSTYQGILNGASGKATTILELAKIISGNFDQNIVIDNNEDKVLLEDSAVVSVEKLETIINVKSFLSLSDGIKKMLQ